MGCEPHAYIAFTALMERLKDNFSTDGVTMTKKYVILISKIPISQFESFHRFEHLSCALANYDPIFFAYLKRHHVCYIKSAILSTPMI